MCAPLVSAGVLWLVLATINISVSLLWSMYTNYYFYVNW